MPAELGGLGDPGSCSALAGQLTGTASRVELLRRELVRLAVDARSPDLTGQLAELDDIVTDLLVLGEAVGRLASDLGPERAPGGPTIRDRTRSGRSLAAVERVARSVRPVP